MYRSPTDDRSREESIDDDADESSAADDEEEEEEEDEDDGFGDDFDEFEEGQEAADDDFGEFDDGSADLEGGGGSFESPIPPSPAPSSQPSIVSKTHISYRHEHRIQRHEIMKSCFPLLVNRIADFRVSLSLTSPISNPYPKYKLHANHIYTPCSPHIRLNQRQPTQNHHHRYSSPTVVYHSIHN
jgi:hypothetical protein